MQQSLTTIRPLLVVLVVTSLLWVDGRDNGLALLPPMGWTSKERFGCQTDCDNYPDDCISERLIRSMADVMSLPSFQRLGFRYIVIDDCWMDKNRDATGKLQADIRRFPRGIQDLIAYVHSKNLKIGLNLDVGNQTCGQFPGSQGHFALDAQTMVSWQVDMVKIGACGISDPNACNRAYLDFGRQLNLTNRSILTQCDWPGAIEAKGGGQVGNYTDIARTCNLFKVYSKDIQDVWDSMVDIFKFYSDRSYLFRDWVGPGRYSDADSLLMGNFGLSSDQERFQLAFWALIASPLFLSADLRTISPESKRILLNKYVIDISQDPLGDMARQVSTQGQPLVWKKRLSTRGSYALGLFSTNIFGQPNRLSFQLSDYGVTDAVIYNVTDVLTGYNYGLHKPWQTVDCEVNPTGARLLLFTPVRVPGDEYDVDVSVGS